MAISEATYMRVAQEDDDGKWELVCGQLRSKPGMTMPHNNAGFMLGYQLQNQLDIRLFRVRVEAGRVRTSTSYFIPDVMVLPVALMAEWAEREHDLEIYSDPLPFVAEVWSRSTGGYDIASKVPEYQQRDDREIWRIHPYEQSLVAWRLQDDGSYIETAYQSGDVPVLSLPGVSIRLESLFG